VSTEPVGDAGSPPAAWVPTYPTIRRLDELWYKAERIVCGAIFLFMSLLVFAAVVRDAFATRHEWMDVVILFGLVWLAVRTRTVKEGERKLDHVKSLIAAVVVTAAIAGGVYFYTESFPEGFVFAQKLALVMMLWVALLGASMATYERAHLALELGEKIWPKAMLRYVKAFAHAVTSAFCLALAILSYQLVSANAHEGAFIEANEWLPRWTAFLVMPYVFGAMAVRMLAQSVTLATDAAEPEEDRLPT
jgi:TRAP-type C4-dicarboxylate transport system permease small subunit